MSATASPHAFHHASQAVRLARLRRLAWMLDAAFRLPFTRFRFGFNGVVGLTPAVGDAAMALVSLYIVNEARLLGVPPHLLGRMVGNVVAEAVMGSVPVLGDVLDMAFKANLRNLAIIEEHLGVSLRRGSAV